MIRSKPFAWALGAGVCAVGLLILFLFNPGAWGFYPVCTFYRTTGLQCPGCGSLRAMHQLLHGHLAAAFQYNGLLICSLPFAGWMLGRFAIASFRGQPLPIINRWWLWSGLVLLVAFGVLRNFR